jgi:poly(3-hydroxybutyrate) depolymerase
MEMPVMLQGESLKRLVQGAVVGAVATMIVGFNWGGWMLGSSARTVADSTAASAVVAAIAPICVNHFQHSADATTNMATLRKTSEWDQASFVEKGGWAVMPGSKDADSGVSQACANLLASLK